MRSRCLINMYLGTKIIQSELFWQKKICHATVTWYGYKGYWATWKENRGDWIPAKVSPLWDTYCYLTGPLWGACCAWSGGTSSCGSWRRGRWSLVSSCGRSSNRSRCRWCCLKWTTNKTAWQEDTQLFTKDKINSQKISPTGVTVFEPAALSGGGIWKK